MAGAFPGSVESCPAGFGLSDGAVAVLPLMRLKKLRGLARSLHSMFPGVYGGPVCTRALTSEERLAINEWLAGREGMRTFCLAPPGVSNPVPEGCRRVEAFTQRVDLSGGFAPDGLPEPKKRNIRKAEREGVEVRIAESPEHWPAYYDAYVESMRRWNERPVYVYPHAFFEALKPLEGQGAALWIATVKGEPAGGAIILTHGQSAVYWHGASFEKFHSLRVNDLLHVRIMEDAARAGIGFYDLCPSGGHEGVVRFKASFGAEKVPLEAWIREPGWVRGGKRLRSLFRQR